MELQHWSVITTSNVVVFFVIDAAFPHGWNCYRRWMSRSTQVQRNVKVEHVLLSRYTRLHNWSCLFESVDRSERGLLEWRGSWLRKRKLILETGTNVSATGISSGVMPLQYCRFCWGNKGGGVESCSRSVEGSTANGDEGDKALRGRTGRFINLCALLDSPGESCKVCAAPVQVVDEALACSRRDRDPQLVFGVVLHRWSCRTRQVVDINCWIIPSQIQSNKTR